MFRIIYAGGVCVFSQSGRVISTETDECSQTTAEWLLLGVTLTEIDEHQPRCLVQRTIDATAKNCIAADIYRGRHLRNSSETGYLAVG